MSVSVVAVSTVGSSLTDIIDLRPGHQQVNRSGD